MFSATVMCGYSARDGEDHRDVTVPGLLDADRSSIAAGTATVMTEGTELCDVAVVDELLPLVVAD